MKRKKTLNTIIEEVIANGIGWIAGLLSIDLLDLIFIKKSFWNLGGFFSKRIAVSKDEFSLLEWLLTAIIGFIVMIIINKFIRKKFFKKKLDESKMEEIKSKEQVITTVNEENVYSIESEEQTTPENKDADLNDETNIPPKTE